MFRVSVCFCALTLLVGCDGSEPVPVTITPDQRIRQISEVDYSSLLASVSFNFGVEQEINFTDSAPRTLAFTNINRGKFNDYDITWFEVIDGLRLTIASQSGQFLADSSGSGTTLGGNYNFAYDNNHDGVANLTEREAGSCPWVACNELGGLLDPQEITEIISDDVNFLLSKNGPREWLETVDTSGPHNWVLTQYTRTSIMLNDVSRNVRFDVDLFAGIVRINDTPDDEFRPLYIIDGVQ